MTLESTRCSSQSRHGGDSQDHTHFCSPQNPIQPDYEFAYNLLSSKERFFPPEITVNTPGYVLYNLKKSFLLQHNPYLFSCKYAEPTSGKLTTLFPVKNLKFQASTNT